MDTSILLEIYKKFILSTSTSETFAVKCPDHLLFLDDISKVFEDAKIVWIHRDPYDSICSYSPMIFSAWKLFFKNVEKKNVGDFVVNLYERMLLKSVKDRKKIGNQIIDIQYSDLIGNPEGISQMLSVELNKNIILKSKKTRKSTNFFKNKFKFDITEYELSKSEIDNKFSFYTKEFIRT